MTKVEIEMLKEQNNILKEELELLKKLNPNLAIKFSEDLAEDLGKKIKKINEETNVDSCIQENIISPEKKNNSEEDYDSDSFV